MINVDKKITRLILKNDDVLVVKVPIAHPFSKEALRSIYIQIKKQLHPKKNKILMIPNDIELSVIGNKEIKEHVTELDIWQLWDEEDGKIIVKEGDDTFEDNF